jgi:hypothetical protein
MFSSSLLSTWIRGNCRLHNTHFTFHDGTLFLLLHFYVFYREAPPPSPAMLCRNFPFLGKLNSLAMRGLNFGVSGLHLPSLLIYLFVQDEELLLYEDGKVVFTPSLPLPPPFPSPPTPSPPFSPPPPSIEQNLERRGPVWRQISFALERGIIIEELFF